MTVDDGNSIYVGGLPYDCTDSQLRRVFELYGSILAVKIKNDREIGGKCYGFVTFTNPRSTVEAINEMDGKMIGGRVVRVNEVKSRGTGGRSFQGREGFRHNQRDGDWDGGRGRGRVREKVYDRDRQHDNSREIDGERERYNSREIDGERERWRGRSRDHDLTRDNFQRRDRGQSRETQSWEHHNSRDRDRELDRDFDMDGTADAQLDKVVDNDRENDKNRDHQTKRKHSSSYERQSREHSSESSDFYHKEEQLDLLIKRRDELYKEKSDMEQSLEEKKQLIADLQKRSMKLEDSLTLAKKKTAVHQLRLTKLYKCFQQVKEYGEKLKSSEHQLKDLVDSVSMEIDPGNIDVRDI